MPTPTPRDPRTPLQAAQARLNAAHHQMVTTYLPHDKRRDLADRITNLRAEVDQHTPTVG